MIIDQLTPLLQPSGVLAIPELDVVPDGTHNPPPQPK